MPKQSRPLLLRRPRFTAGLILLTACFLLGSQALQAQSAPAPQQPPDAAAGLQIYQENCQRCHGSFGRGQGEMAAQLPVQPPNFANWGYLQDVVPNEAFRIVTEGRIDNLMPPWSEALSQQERWDVLFGLWSYGLTPERMLRGRRAWQADCSSCHGDLDSLEAQVPLEISEPAFWLDRSLNQVRAGMFGSAGATAAHGPAVQGAEAQVALALAYARSAIYRPLSFEQLSLDGHLQGQVVNGSAGASGVAGARVMVVPFDGPSGEILPSEAISVTVDADGAFDLQGLLAGPDLSYRLVTSFGGADYVFEEAVPLPAAAGAPARVELAVFENDPQAPLDARMAQIVLAPLPDEGLVSVAEAWVFRNAGDRTRSAPVGGHVLRFDLPPDARGVRFDDPRIQAGARVDGGTVFTQMPIPPGETRVMLSYALAYEGTALDFERSLSLPVDELQLIAVGEELELESALLDAPRIERRGEERVVVASATALGADARLEARLAGLPALGAIAATAPDTFDHGRITRGGLSAMALLVILALLYPAIAARTDRADDPSRHRSLRSALIARIAGLDRSLAKGELALEAHAERRAALFEQALALSRVDAGKDEIG